MKGMEREREKWNCTTNFPCTDPPRLRVNWPTSSLIVNRQEGKHSSRSTPSIYSSSHSTSPSSQALSSAIPAWTHEDNNRKFCNYSHSSVLCLTWSRNVRGGRVGRKLATNDTLSPHPHSVAAPASDKDPVQLVVCKSSPQFHYTTMRSLVATTRRDETRRRWKSSTDNYLPNHII